MPRFPARQVHLDFHTAEQIPAVGAHFDRRQWQRALRLGRVDSITVFAKCHHSWSYYPTHVGRPHPHLATDLLGQQIAASHAINVRCPIYYTVGWSANDAEDNPDWCARDRAGHILTMNYDLAAPPSAPKPPVSWKFLCYGTEYRDLILEQTREICAHYPCDGFFYDICNLQLCHCPACRDGMRANHLNPADDFDVRQYAMVKARQFMADCRSVIHGRHPDATIFFNGLTKIDTPPEVYALQTHFELEDLPTTWGGYDKLPLRAKRYAAADKPMLAMSGKFHTQWGEFGGFKHPDAIRFEAAAMLAFGAGCSFGDQLHPSGAMDLETYRRIGHAYRYVEAIEPYTLPGRPCASLGLLLTQQHAHDQGMANCLLEGHVDFEVAPPDADWSRYETMILPGARFLDAALASRLAKYLKAGGKLLALGDSLLDPDGRLLLPSAGVRYLGPARYENDYLLVDAPLARDLPRSPFLNYTPAGRYTATRAKTLAKIHEPFFNRTYEHYCSHMNTPYRLEPAEQGGAFLHNNLLLLPHPHDAMYHAHGARVHRDLLLNALRKLHRRPMLQVELPSAARVNLIHQPAHRRYVVHLLYGPPLQRGRCAVIEDLVPLRVVPVQLRVPHPIRRAFLPLARRRLPISRAAGAVRVRIPQVQCHQAVVFEY